MDHIPIEEWARDALRLLLWNCMHRAADALENEAATALVCAAELRRRAS